jgi:23S rRNA (guanosine2251-2'-O)-methyltransferase
VEIEKLSLKQLNRPGLDEYSVMKKLDYLVVADNIRSGQNVGSIFRTADAFAAEKICLVGLSPVPPNKEILKSALGATESVKWEQYPDASLLIAKLREENVRIVVVEQTTASVSLDTFSPAIHEKYALVFGNEVDGVSAEFIKHADIFLEVPQMGTKHSLNVSVCAGIVMWHCFSRMS